MTLDEVIDMTCVVILQREMCRSVTPLDLSRCHQASIVSTGHVLNMLCCLISL